MKDWCCGWVGACVIKCHPGGQEGLRKHKEQSRCLWRILCPRLAAIQRIAPAAQQDAARDCLLTAQAHMAQQQQCTAAGPSIQ